MSRSKADVCGYKGCSEPAAFIIELDSRRMPICREHYRLIVKRLQERAERNGSAELLPTDLSKDSFE